VADGGESKQAAAAAAVAVDVLPGGDLPVGAHWDGQGTNFSLFSEHADAVELCLSTSTALSVAST
jgi:pullulanase/glycogen debranching enzyme